MDYNFDLHTMSRKSAGLPLAFSLGMLIFDLNDFIFLPLFKMAIERRHKKYTDTCNAANVASKPLQDPVIDEN